MTAPSKQLDQFVVRLPDGMRDRIKTAADANNRSMNAEIVATLEEKYPAPVTQLIRQYEFLSQELDNLALELNACLDQITRATNEDELEVARLRAAELKGRTDFTQKVFHDFMESIGKGKD